MGLFERLFNKPPQSPRVQGGYSTLNSRSPSFAKWGGNPYEQRLIRSCIESGARQCSKLQPNVTGSAGARLQRNLRVQPNPWQTTPQFIARVWRILKMDTTAFIAPLYADDLETVVGFVPLRPSYTEAVKVEGELWYRFTFGDGRKVLAEASTIGVLTEMQLESDIFGGGSKPLTPTMTLIQAQDEAQRYAIENGARIDWMARVSGQVRPEDLEAKRQNFSLSNLTANNTSGLMLYDNTLEDLKQVAQESYTMSKEDQDYIRRDVYGYFGINESILQNDYKEETWNAYYEGQIEPFAVQLGAVLTAMAFTPLERSYGNEIMFSANRLAYASNSTKLAVVVGLRDRGGMDTNQMMDVFQLPHVPEEENSRVIRGEYIDTKNLPTHTIGKTADTGDTEDDTDVIDAEIEGGTDAL